MTRTASRTAIGVFAAVVAMAASIGAPAEAARTASSGAASPPKGGSRAGVSRRVIKIGMHAPLTGAVPVPSDSMEKGKDLFFRWLRSQHKPIHHRRVKVILANDNYNPSEAVAACKKLVEEDHVFAIVGFSGVDQIQACARYARSKHVPYLAPGTTERALDLPQTFATTMTWPDQGPLMSQFMVKKLKARRRKSAIVFHDTPNYKDARTAFVRAMHRRDASVYKRSVPIGANTADATAIIQELQARSIKNVDVLVTPVFFLQMIRAASQRSYAPNWTSVDPAMTVDTVASTACGFNNGLDGSKFFSPYPAFGDRDSFDKKFGKAMERFYSGDEGDSFVWGNWAQQKVIARLLRLPGRNLTRKRFVWFAEHSKRIATGVGSRVRYRPKNHFGADQVHLLEARCSDRRWHTVRSFIDHF
jgi:ABC-type branched-subunit amino acid transport system substrate-binding protein